MQSPLKATTRSHDGKPLTAAEAVEFTGQLQGLVTAGLPLPSGLLALSAEVPDGSHRRMLEDLAGRLDRGESLEFALEAEGPRFPAQLRGLIAVGVRSGRLGEALARFLEMEDHSDALRRRLRSGLMYPACMLLLSFSLFVFVSMITTDGFGAVFEDFGIPIPMITQVLIVASRGFAAFGWWLMVGPLIGAFVIWATMRLTLSRMERDRLMQSLPLVGPLARDTALAQFCPILAMLLESEIPLPEALRLAAGGTRDSAIGGAAREVADRVERGESFSEAVRGVKPFPRGFDAFLEWAEGHRGLVEGLQLAAESFQVRARSRAVFVSRFCNVITMTVVLWWVGLTVLALLLPLVYLINAVAGPGMVAGDAADLMKMVGIGIVTTIGVAIVGLAVWPLLARRGRIRPVRGVPWTPHRQQDHFWYLAAIGWTLFGLVVVLLLSGRLMMAVAEPWLPDWWAKDMWGHVQVLGLVIAGMGLVLVAFAAWAARANRKYVASVVSASTGSKKSPRTTIIPTWRFGLRHMMFAMAPLALLMVMLKEFGTSLFAFLALLIPPFALVAVFLALGDRKSIQREALLQVMAMAARDAQPLGPAIAAFAPMCRGQHGLEVAELATLLERGATLPEALDRVPRVLNSSSTTIARVGWSTGTLSRVLDDAVEISAAERTARGATVNAVAYPLGVLTVVMGLGVLMTVLIAPRIIVLFKDMQVQLPEPTRSIFAASVGKVDRANFGDMTPIGLGSAAIGGLLFAAVLVLFLLMRRGWDFLPLLDRFSTRRHASIILKASAAAVDGGRSITDFLDLMASTYPRVWIRNRLRRAAEMTRQGKPWVESLRRQGLISRADAAILDAAQRVGNLPWALRQTAQSGERRQLYRLTILGQLFQMFTIVGLGGVVLLFAATYFQPLITLIDAMSRNLE